MANGTVNIVLKDCNPIEEQNVTAAFGVIITKEGIRAYQMGITNAFEQLAAVARLREMADEMMARTPFRDDPEILKIAKLALGDAKLSEEAEEPDESEAALDGLLKSIFGANAEEKGEDA